MDENREKEIRAARDRAALFLEIMTQRVGAAEAAAEDAATTAATSPAPSPTPTAGRRGPRPPAGPEARARQRVRDFRAREDALAAQYATPAALRAHARAACASQAWQRARDRYFASRLRGADPAGHLSAYDPRTAVSR